MTNDIEERDITDAEHDALVEALTNAVEHIERAAPEDTLCGALVVASVNRQLVSTADMTLVQLVRAGDAVMTMLGRLFTEVTNDDRYKDMNPTALGLAVVSEHMNARNNANDATVAITQQDMH